MAVHGADASVGEGNGSEMSNLTGKMILDDTGREIRTGDLIRIPHFRTRRKKYWMYMLVFECEGFMRAIHTYRIPTKELNIGSSILLRVACMGGAKILSGFNCKEGELSFEDRPRLNKEVAT